MGETKLILPYVSVNGVGGHPMEGAQSGGVAYVASNMRETAR